MRKVLIFVFFSFQLSAFSQTMEQLVKLASDYYQSQKYLEAVEFYEHIHQLIPNDKKIHFQLANCLFKSLQYERAKVEFEALSQKGGFVDSVSYNLGLSYKTLGNYHEADSVFGQLLDLIHANNVYYDLSEFQRAGCKLGLRQSYIKNDREFSLKAMLNSESHDFGAIQNSRTKNFVIATNRKTKQKQYFDGQYGDYLPNLLSFTFEGEKSRDFEEMNSQWAEGTGSFTADGNTFYFSSCQKDEGCKIMVSELVEGVWSSPYAMPEPINVSGFDVKQPSVSSTGDTLFFSSNRVGGRGGMDIWMSIRLSDTIWIPPINFGETVNTSADEITPYYTSAYSAIVFASNGHAGYGGYDLYIAKGESFYSPGIYNLGRPFNSPLNDTYFSLGTDGYISSDRDGNDFNIYSFKYLSEVKLMQSFLSPESLIDLKKYREISLGLETFRLEDYEGYALFQPIKTKEEKLEKDADNEHVMITGSGQPEGEVRLLIDENNIIATMVEDDGRFEFQMMPDSIGSFEVSVNNIATPVKVLSKKYEYYRYGYETIYFSFGSHELRSESKESLNDLARYFRPENVILIDIHTHADMIGSHDFNFALSEKRGFEVMKYLNKRQIAFDKAHVYANGESNPITNENTWYDRLLNRRAELIVYTKEPVAFPKVSIFIIKRDISVTNAAKQFGTTVSKIKEWNGLVTDNLYEGHVLRILDPMYNEPSLSDFISQEYFGENMFTHMVKKGETLQSIAIKYRVPEELISEINNLKGKVSPGQKVIILY